MMLSSTVCASIMVRPRPGQPEVPQLLLRDHRQAGVAAGAGLSRLASTWSVIGRLLR